MFPEKYFKELDILQDTLSTIYYDEGEYSLFEEKLKTFKNDDIVDKLSSYKKIKEFTHELLLNTILPGNNNVYINHETIPKIEKIKNTIRDSASNDLDFYRIVDICISIYYFQDVKYALNVIKKYDFDEILCLSFLAIFNIPRYGIVGDYRLEIFSFILEDSKSYDNLTSLNDYLNNHLETDEENLYQNDLVTNNFILKYLELNKSILEKSPTKSKTLFERVKNATHIGGFGDITRYIDDFKYKISNFELENKIEKLEKKKLDFVNSIVILITVITFLFSSVEIISIQSYWSGVKLIIVMGLSLTLFTALFQLFFYSDFKERNKISLITILIFSLSVFLIIDFYNLLTKNPIYLSLFIIPIISHFIIYIIFIIKNTKKNYSIETIYCE